MHFCCLHEYIYHAKGLKVIALSSREKGSLKNYIHLGTVMLAGTILYFGKVEGACSYMYMSD